MRLIIQPIKDVGKTGEFYLWEFDMTMAVRLTGMLMIIAALALAGACTRGGGGPKPGQDTPPGPSPTPTPTATVTPAPTPEQGEPGEVELSWDSTAFNRDRVQGFHIWRGNSFEGPFYQMTSELIDIDSDEEGILRFVDRNVTMGKTYFYRIQIVTKVGDRVFYRDPFEITVNRPRGLTPE